MIHNTARKIFPIAAIVAAVATINIAATHQAMAQSDKNSTRADEPKQSEQDARLLPDAPSAWMARGPAATSSSEQPEERVPRFGSLRLITAPKYASVIEPEYQPQGLTVLSKSAYGLRELFSYHFPVEVLISSGISHGANSDPLYGTNRNAFAQRVGAAGARQASQVVLSDVIMAPLLHEDPRYYAMGSGHSMFKRAGYAATRVLFTRTDSGKTTPNLALLAGYGGSAALTQLYYPVRSRDTTTVLSGYGLSLGGRAIGYELAEFFRFLNSKQPHPAYGGFQ